MKSENMLTVLFLLFGSCCNISQENAIKISTVYNENNIDTIVQKMKPIKSIEFNIKNNDPQCFGYTEPENGIPEGINSILVIDSSCILILDNYYNNIKLLDINTGNISKTSPKFFKEIIDLWLFNDNILVSTDNYEYLYIIDKNLEILDSINTQKKGKKEIYNLRNNNLQLSYVGNIIKSTNNYYNHKIELISINETKQVDFLNTDVTSDDIFNEKLNGFNISYTSHSLFYNNTNYIFPDSIYINNDYSGERSVDIRSNIAAFYYKKNNKYHVRIYVKD